MHLRRTAFLFGKRLLYPGIDVATRERRRFARQFMPGPVRTLDVGSGNGAFSIAAYSLGNSVLGIDLNPDNVARSREYASFLGADPARLRFEHRSAYDLELGSASFDQIIVFEVLEHLARDQMLLNLLAGLLEPGGVMHVSTPYLDRRPYAGEVLTQREDGGHLRLGYTFDRLEEMVRLAGLTPIARATAVGPVSRALLETVNRVQTSFGRPTAVATWLLGAPLAAAERMLVQGRLPPGRALIIYVKSGKSV